MAVNDEKTETLLRRAATDDSSAVSQLMKHYRSRVRKLVTIRMDQRLTARIDPSDVVQETLLEAARKLPKYLRHPDVPFYPWLRALAINRLIDFHRQHLGAQRRNVRREEPWTPTLSNESAMQLADRLISSASSPSRRAERNELRQQVRLALERLPDQQREILVMKYLEELSSTEIASVLGIPDRTIRRRHRQAVEQLADLLSDIE